MQIESKSNLGSTVWFMHNNRPVSAVVTRIKVTRGLHERQQETVIVSSIDGHSNPFDELEFKFPENDGDIHPTREALIASL